MTSKTPIDDSSSDKSLHPQDHQQKTPEKVPGVEESKEDPHQYVNTPTSDEKSTFHKDLTEHAAALKKTMESAMADLTDPESQQEDSNLHTKMENLIDQALQHHIDKLLSRLNQAEKDLLDSNTKYETLQMEHNNKLHNKHTDLQLQCDRLNGQTNYNSRALETLEDRVSSLEMSTKEMSNTLFFLNQ